MRVELGLAVGIFLFAYPFIIYPILLRIVAPRREEDAAREQQHIELPSLAMVICAFNEAGVIGRKLENCLTLDYPKGRFRIIVISDGSIDTTAEIVSSYAGRGVELIEQRRRRGKVANLNDVIPCLEEGIVVLSDANVFYDRNSLRRLTDKLWDPTVGCVSGKVILKNAEEALRSTTDGYYSLEWALQEGGSRLHSMMGADGAMYAVRRNLFQRCANDTVVEDFVIPMSVVRQGYRVVFQPEAIGWENGATSIREEFRRKVRISAGAAQQLLRGPAWPGRAPVRVWFVFISHKLLRWLSPLVAAATLIIALSAPRSGVSQAVLAGSALLIALALLRVITGSTRRVFEAPFYFVFGQIAIVLGLLRGVAGLQPVMWAKVDR